ncbi:glycosyltransferase [Vibrio fluvialis]|uniref:glycosyltransferase n=1 Tax=Vibrio fluvialis TaxID=676 RepID=UPI0012AD60FC|nr:glycosyltransferase [Vibrio fluvialis]EKO3382062.1 glycosyltransferase [Vibrio fluvialis]EKO3403576.1 glycosyltransferase [Vibrio fluvialis]EKO3501371.1 glycosyltransferase [Vibrio fluvialis]EKO3541126.1 glycosyltransferase [Vibrio fluvialis]EKO3918121.1 glycosyltransferase [Vibrio fluvialis]
MNIKFLIRDLKIEGVQVVTVRLARLLKAKGHDVEIITLFNDIELPKLEDLTISCLDIPIPERCEKTMLDRFKAWYKGAKFDYLIAPHSESIKLIAHFSDSRLIPFIHNSDEYSYNQRSFFKRFRYRVRLAKRLKGKHVISVSESIRAFTTQCCGDRILSANVLYNPFDIEAIRHCACEKEGLAAQEEYLLFVGRLEKQKRVDRLLTSFSYVKNPSIKLVILGEGSLEQKLKIQAEELNLGERVEFKKFDTNPYPIIKGAKAVILTSDHEGLPTVIIEALILGIPALSVNCPSGPDEILTGDLSKYLIHSYDEKVIAERIDALLEDRDIPDLSAGYEKFTEEKVYQSFMTIVEQWNNDKH